MRTSTSVLFLLVAIATCAQTGEAPDRGAVVAAYADLVYANYADALADAKRLRADLAAFVDTPDPTTLATARAAWLAARESYGQSEAFRFYAGPIDDEDGPEALINAWPLDEFYIDATGAPEGTGAGIVDDPETHPEITAEMLIGLNEKEGDANISTGYHAIEFLLWGRDTNEDPFACGDRPASDFADAPHAGRRGRYLLVCADLLIDHLGGLVAEWDPDADDNYRAGFVADPDAALGKIVTGVGSLAGHELAGERMAVALENRDQEDEHSCFSDNTHRDVVLNVMAIANLWRGRYRASDGTVTHGTSLRDLVAGADPEAVAAIDAALVEAERAAAAIRHPFDRELVTEDGRARITAAIESLWTFARLLPGAAAALGVESPIEGL